MRILQVDSGREWRGGQNQVRLLCRELGKDAGIEQVLVTKHGSELARRAGTDGVAVQGTTWEIGLDPRAWWHLRRTIAAFRPDVIHVHDSHALTLGATVALGRTLVAARRVDFHVGRFGVWRRPDRIIAVSEAVKGILTRDGIAAGAITVVHDGVDPDQIRRAATPGLDIRSRLRIPAGAPLAAEIARLELEDRVHLIGYVDRIDALIAEASVFVMSSKTEGLGSVILNALALGRPVVATAAGGIPELLPAEVLVPAGSPDALAQKVVDVLKHPTPLPFPPRFTASAMAHGVLDVYRALL